MIKSQGAISRHITEYLTDARVKHYKCKTLQNPDYFFDGSAYGAVDVSHKLDTSTEKAGGLFLRDKAIVSVGTKKADDAYKLFGLRPDENQNGSESVEWSVESIEINGKAQTINLRDRLEVSPITTKFGDNLYIQRARQRCRIMVPGGNLTESFKLTFRLHLKGCTVQYRADLDEYWIFRGGVFFCRLVRPYLVDPETMNPFKWDFVKHSLVEIGKGEYIYTKEPTPEFVLANLPASFLIDADTVYSSTSDGQVYTQNVATWTLARDATTGTVSSASTDSMTAIVVDCGFSCSRTFLYYSLSGISGTVTEAIESLYGSMALSTIVNSVQKGTQADTLSAGDFDSFSGNTYGTKSGWSTSGYNSITYDAAGRSDVQSAEGGTFKSCWRNYTYDYQNVSPAPSSYAYAGIYFSEQTGYTKDPYLYITTAAAASYIHGIMGHHFIPSFMGGR